MGYSFVLTIGSEFEDNIKILDFVIHPNYFAKAEYIVNETCRIANNSGISEVYAFSPTCDEKKVSILKEVGFTEEYRFINKFKLKEKDYDLLLFKK